MVDDRGSGKSVLIAQHAADDYILGAMGKLSCKLYKNENYTDVLLHLIYLLRLYDNILK